MRALVTGASGCLGRALVEQLSLHGWDVGTTARQPVALPGFRAADLVRADLGPLLDGIDVVFHCAALSSAWGTREEFHAANVLATRRLLEAAERAGVMRFVLASSPSIYADGTDRLDLAEDAPLPARPLSLYAESKREAERMVLAHAGAMACTAIRPRAIYGRHDRALLPRLIEAMRRGRVPMIRGGRALIDLTHRHDAARGMILAASGPRGGVWNITSGEAFRFRDLAEIIAHRGGLRLRGMPLPHGLARWLAGASERLARMRGGAEPRLTLQAVASLGSSLTLDISAARRDLGYRPRVGFEEGVAECFA
ncbi:NAD-dependent epimerase/dehydratase family protein [Paracoccus sp. PS-1]|uniref:NAD-dependent epimerase/dehydratase family protein n=1 Tax=unclassified Paracoccus (in: a-proteobacteria) TaxID=2688777 RepID=UPI00048C35D1|nr:MULTISPECIES: NAD-dependent epimerase/dehydratase family protein [unclassified Paracoccus (in: a-proteobacteria)]MDQ7262062.1 NAD-dependent epimerase/dehydratase family protein [Paracoccus sp. PS1]RQP05909.1 MAG: NAD-dependent epimerase/dehydratase family protein [Paracoccus sp. BP8]UFM67074.1 NAD-dependent epimerase/dehydratase family protein [Paracoccus sp. MA]